MQKNHILLWKKLKNTEVPSSEEPFSGVLLVESQRGSLDSDINLPGLMHINVGFTFDSLIGCNAINIPQSYKLDV